MKKKLPKFRHGSKGPLTDQEHTECVKTLGALYLRMIDVLAGTEHFMSGRVQIFRKKPCPCIYVFYNKNTFDDDQRGLMYIIQDLENAKGFEIVFREWNSVSPLSDHNWSKLRDDDRYKVCSYYNWRWRTFKVRTEEDFVEAMKLIKQAKQKFEEIFEITR